jgi:pyridinium-3,5-bisthiocarboxylic acid mononucleotide nickel chelatase
MFRKVSTEWGPVTVKEGMYDGQVVQSAPEYEECKRIAQIHNIPLKKVYEMVWKALGNEN